MVDVNQWGRWKVGDKVTLKKSKTSGLRTIRSEIIRDSGKTPKGIIYNIWYDTSGTFAHKPFFEVRFVWKNKRTGKREQVSPFTTDPKNELSKIIM